MNNQFSQRVSDIITYSKEEANRLKNRYIGPEHLLLGMLRDGGGKAIEILQKLDIDLNRVKKRLEGFLKEIEDDNLLPDADIPLSPMAAKILKMCILEARLLKSATADTEHVLLAILKDGNNLAATVLEENNIDYKSVFEQLSMKASPNAGMGFTEDDDEEEDEMNMSSRSSQSGSSQSSTQTASKKPSNDTPVLDNFGMDMTRAAEEGRLDPVVGREREIERLAQILSRRKKNNPVLIGEPGVGKSAIVEGLALRIVQKKVSRILFDKRVVMLDMASVVAGTKYRGQFEERIRSIINELQKNPNVILFIDEIHTIVGAGAAAGSMDAANMLKPALARGEIQCIGATTLDEYRKNIEKDGALERRFQKVIVEPTTAEETLQILKNIKEKYEDHHNVTYTDEALEACVKLTDRYITDRNFPDKAIDALDEAGSRVHLTNITVPKEIEEQEKLIEEARQQKADAVKSQNFELAASFRDHEKEFSARLEEMKAEWEARLKDDRQIVGEEEIERKVLRFLPADTGKTYWHDGENYWRVMAFIPNARTYETVDPEYSYYAGVAFGNFQAMLADIPDELGETIPDFHNMEFRLKQLRDAVAADAAGRVKEVRYFLDEIERRADEMCKAERLHREGKLPKRVCHCDTKVNNMMFDENGNVLCVIDLDTVMPSFVFSDFGDFLRSGANTGLEDDKDLANVNFDMEIFKAFTKGYLESAKSFLLPIEIENLPYAAALFPYMQCVRFLADYINGDTYYKIQYPEHNLVRTKAQFKLLQSVEEHTPEMQKFIASCI